MRQLLTKGGFFIPAAACLLFFTLLGFILQYSADVLIPLVFAFLLAFIALPLTKKLEKWRFPRWLSASLGVLFIMVIISGVIVFLSYQISDLADDMPAFKVKLQTKVLELQTYIRHQWGLSVNEQNSWVNKQMKSADESMSTYAMNFFSATGAFLAAFFIVPILTFFLLIYRDRFRNFLGLVDEKYNVHTCYLILEVGKVSQAFIKGIAIDTLIITMLNCVGFWAIGLKYALLLALIAGILNIIPYIGGIVGSLIPVLFAFITMDSSGSALAIFAVVLVVQFLDNNFIGPKVIGSSVSVNPLFSTIALMIGALIWGITGMLLAMPLAGMLKVVFDNLPSLQPYGYLMGEEKKYEQNSVPIKQNFISYLRRALS